MLCYSVERLFSRLTDLNGHPALDPIIITPDGEITVQTKILSDSRKLCTLLHGNR